MTEASRSSDRVDLWVQGHLASVLGHASDRIDAASSLEELGLESMSVVAMGRVFESHFPLLPRTFLYDCRTVGDVSAGLRSRFPDECRRLEESLGPARAAFPSFPDEWRPLDDELPVLRSATGAECIAIVGLAGRYPGAGDIDAFADLLLSGIDSVSDVPSERWAADDLFSVDPVARARWASSSRWGAFLRDVDAFDAQFFGVSAADADVMDPQERLFIECAWHALEHAALGPERLPRSEGGAARVGVFAGVTTLSYPLLGEAHWRAGGGQVPTGMPWSVANRVSWLFDFDGPSLSLDTACSSSLTALHLACEALRRDECAVALAGGVNLYLHPSKYVQLSQQRMLSPTGRCHAFGAAADGFVPGEGVGVAVLRRLDDAIAAGDRILGVIRATGIAHGGRTTGYTVPSSRSQADLIRATLARSGVPARRVGYVEAHGTGTSLGDPIEVDGLLTAWGNDRPQACALGSVKGNIGHLESAAGIAGLTRILLQLRSGTLFPSLHGQPANPAIDFVRSPFSVPQTAAPWPEGPDGSPRVALLSSFGAGGANAHVVIEEWRTGSVPASGNDGRDTVSTVFPFSADDDAQLACVIDDFLRWLAPRIEALDHPAGRAALAATLQCGRTALRSRLAVVAPTLAELRRRLQARGPECWHGRNDGSPADVWQRRAAEWAAGGPAAWRALWSALPPPLDIPLYPFRRTRHWIGGVQAPALTRFEGAVTAQPGEQLVVDATDWRLRNHIVDGQPVFPAAAYIEELVARAAAGAGIELNDLMWGRPLVGDAGLAQLLVQREASGRCVVRAAHDKTVTHLRGSLVSGAGQTPPLLPIAAPSPDALAGFDRAAFYARFAAMGLAYGPAFQSVRALQRGADHALALIESDAGSGRIDPALLDGVFQCAVAMAPESVLASGRAFVPFSVRRFVLWGSLRGRVRARIDYRGSPAPGLHAFNFTVAGEDGTVIVQVDSFCFRAWDGARAGTLHLLARSWQTVALPAARITRSVLLGGASRAALPALTERLQGLADGEPFWRLLPSARFHLHDGRQIDADLDDASHRRSLMEVLQYGGHFPDTLVWMADDAAGDAAAGARRFVLLAQALVGALGSRPLHIVHVATRGSGESDCFHAAVSGVLRSIHLEAPRVSATLLELDSGERTDAAQCARRIAEVLASAAQAGRLQRLRSGAGALLRETFDWLPAAENLWQPSRGATYVITGGLGALGRVFARWLAGCGVHVALLGRSPLDEEGARAIAGLGRDDASVIYVQGDVTDRASLATALQQVRRSLGPVRGVIHAAGVLRDAFFVKHGDDDWKAVLAPKVPGTRLLDEVTREDPLEAFVLCSSLAAAHGNVGQSVYAYANAWLDEYATFRAAEVAGRRRQGRTLSLAWPLWRSEDGMQAPPPVMQWMAERGLELLEAEQGLQALQRAMASTEAGVIVCSGRREGVARLLDVRADVRADLPLDDSAATEAGEGPRAPASSAVQRPAGELAGALCGRLGDMLARACGIARSRITADTPLQSLGLDSIMVMDLNGELDTHFEALSKTLLYEADTVRDLAARIADTEPTAAQRFAGISAVAGVQATVPGLAVDVTEASAPAHAFAALNTATHAVSVPASPRADLPGDAIAIVGIAGRYPRAADLDQFWDNLLQGLDCVTELSQRWPDEPAFAAREGVAAKGGAYARWAALVEEHDCFDPLFFGIAPRDAERMDPQERLFLESSWLAIEDAGYTPQSLQSPPSRDGRRARVGVLAGVMYGEYQYYGAQGSATLSNSSYASIANRVSYTLGFNGASFALDSMCSSSLTALHTACLLLRAGECDAVLAGGVNLSNHPYRYRMLSELQFAASDGRCRSFGAGGDGYVPGEGVGVVLLKRLDDAVRDGDHIHALIRGSALGHGGRTSGFTVPTPVGQSEVIRDAFDQAGVPAARLGYIEAHGTGTSLGDPIELRGLAMALEPALHGVTVPIGSVKSQIGHLESAAGIAALSKVLLQMRHGRLAPSIHSQPANPNIDFSRLPFRVQAEAAAWPAPHAPDGQVLPRLAAISSFGAGGSNAHIVVEEWLAAASAGDRGPVHAGPHIVTLSARTPDSLHGAVRALERHLARASASGVQPDLADIAATLRGGRVAQTQRLALVVDSLDGLRGLLQVCSADPLRTEAAVLPDGVFRGVADPDSAAQPVDASAVSLARAWVSGAFDDWSDQPVPPLRRRVPLPGTVFQRRRFWPQPVAAAPSPVRVATPVPAQSAVPTSTGASIASAPVSPAPAAPARNASPASAAAPVEPAARLSPRAILEQVKSGHMSAEQAKRLLAGMRELADQQEQT